MQRDYGRRVRWIRRALRGRRRAVLCAGFVAVAVIGGAAQGQRSGSGARDRTLPPERAAYTKSGLPGYQLVLANCLTCHSAEVRR